MIVHYHEVVDIFAKCVKESVEGCSWLEHDLEVGELYEVSNIIIGTSSTDVYLKDKQFSYNSVLFEFYENGKEIDIYRDKRFNPYIRHRKGE